MINWLLLFLIAFILSVPFVFMMCSRRKAWSWFAITFPFSVVAALLVGFCLLILISSAPAQSVFFSPKGGCTAEIVKAINSATVSVKIQAFSFTSKLIEEALLGAKLRHLDLMVILDEGWRNQAVRAGIKTVEPLFEQDNIPFLIDGKHSIAHNKIVIIDDTKVLTGSFNLTAQAETSNAENLIVITRKSVIAKFIANFNLHAAHSYHLGTPTPTPPPTTARAERSEALPNELEALQE